MYNRSHRTQSFAVARVLRCLLGVAILSGSASVASAAVTGTAFLDYNGNGVMDTTTMVGGTVPIPAAVDVGVGGITVRATGVTGLGPDGLLNTADDVIGDCGAGPVTTSSVTATLGQYTIATTSCNPGAKIRIEFSGWSTPYNAGVGASTAVQFVSDGATSVNLPLVNPNVFCENNPQLCTSVIVAGDNLTGANNALPTLKSFPYAAGGAALPAGAQPPATNLSIASQTGSVFGLATQRNPKRIFAAAYLRNASGFGPSGPGAIYQVSASGAVSLFTDLNAASMTDASRPGLFGPGAAGVDPLGAHDAIAYEAAEVAGGQVAWGDIDMSEDQSTLYAVNMANLRVYAFPASGPGPITSAAAVGVLPALPFPTTDTRCTAPRSYYYGGKYVGPIAMGLGVHNNALFVGAACGTAAGWGAFFVFRYDLSQGTTGSWTIATKNDNYNLTTQPPRDATDSLSFNLISDIEFVKGDMVIVTRQTTSDWSYPNPPGGGTMYIACANDVLGTTFSWEWIGSPGVVGCTSAINGVLDTANALPSSGRYFSPQDPADAGTRWSNGGMVSVPGSDGFALTVYDPFTTYEAGVAWYNMAGGNVRKKYQLIFGGPYASGQPISAKQTILGDLEALCSAAPVEIGNRIWKDLNGDGIQDPNEPPIAGVTVELRDSSNTLIATAVTDSNGQYLFSNDPRGYPSGINNAPNNTGSNGGYTEDSQGGTASTAAARYGIPFVSGSTYSVVIPNASGAGQQSALAALALTTTTAGSNTALDSNFSASGSSAIASVTIGAPGANNHTIDAGFVAVPTYSLGNRVWFDSNNNGIVDSGEAGIDGVTVQVWTADASGNPTGATPVATDTTQSGGYYLFTGLAAGNYVVVIPNSNFASGAVLSGLYSSGTTQNASGSGTTEAAASTDNTATGTNKDHGSLMSAAIGSVAAGSIKSNLYTLGAGQPTGEDGNSTPGRTDSTADNQSNLTADFGFYAMAIGNLVFRDDGSGGGTANDGIRNGGEVALGGVTVKLYADANGDGSPDGAALASTTTDASGNYLFTGLPGGKYIVAVVPPGGLVGSTPTTAPSNVASDDNKDHGGALTSAEVRSGTITLTPGAGPTGETNAGATAAATVQPNGLTAGSQSNALPDANVNSTIDFGFVDQIDLTIAKTVTSTGPYYAGASQVTYTLVAKNNGPATAQPAIIVKDKLPAGLTAVSATGTNWTCTPQTGAAVEITCTRSSAASALAANASAETITVAASIDGTASGSLLNKAQVNPAANEPRTETNPLGTTPDGYEDGSPSTGSNNDDSKAITAVSAFAIGNRIWYDTNNNGIIDAGEAMIPNVVVELLDGSGNVIKTTATNATGEYLFESLGTGNYTVRVPKENWTGLTSGQVTAAGSPSGLAAGQKPLAGYNNSTGAGGVGANATDATDKGVDAADPTVAGISSAQITLGVGLQPLNESNTADNDGVGPTTSIDANNNMTIDFGFYRLTVGDLVWRDDGNNGATPANVNNGLRDSGEVGIAGVRVELYLGSTLVAVTTTDSNGNYLFDQGTDSAGVVNGKPLVPGTTYQVRIPQATASVNTPLINLLSSAANGASESTPLGANHDDSGQGTAAASAGITSSVNFTLGAGTNSGANSVPTNATGTTAQPNVDFGFAPSYSLGNRVWVDTNNNGIMDSGEVGLANVTVRLLDTSGNPVAGVANQTTDGNGYYRFDGLQPGNYIVEIVPGAVNGVNYVSSTGQNASATGPYEPGTSATAASSNDRDHGTQITPSTIRSNPITLGPTNLVSGEVNAGASNAGANGPNGDMFDVLTGDFGVFLPAKLGNLVWYDSNRNGRADAGEPGLNNVLVILTDGNGVEIARQYTRNNPTTGTPGYYTFDYLIPGNYYVTFFPVNDWLTTVPGTPSIITGTGPEMNDSQPAAGLQVGRSQTVTLAPGDNNPQLDAGFYAAEPIPTMGEAMRNLLAVLLLVVGFAAMRRKAAGLR